MATSGENSDLGKILKQRRVMLQMTLRKLGTMSGVSPSHLGRVERGQRFPSASILRRIAKPLSFEESELFSLADYLTPQKFGFAEAVPLYGDRQLDPSVGMMLAQEPVEVQRTVIGILSILKRIAIVTE